MADFSDPNMTKLLGKGMKFPITLDQYGKAELAEGYEVLISDVMVLMNWPRYTRFMLGDFGTRFEEFLEEPNDHVAEAQLKYETSEVLKTWEPRLSPKNIIIERPNDTTINFKINTQINLTKVEGTFVIPYVRTLNY